MSLRIFDVLGNEVVVLVDEFRPAVDMKQHTMFLWRAGYISTEFKQKILLKRRRFKVLKAFFDYVQEDQI